MFDDDRPETLREKPYDDFEKFKICSILEPVEITYGNSTDGTGREPLPPGWADISSDDGTDRDFGE